MNKLDKDYQNLLKDILENGTIKSDRTGTGTKSVFGRQIRHKMSDGFPLLTTKKMAWKPMVIELLWFLQGGTNIQYLVKNGCNIWNGDAYKNYIKKTDDITLETLHVPFQETLLYGTITGPISNGRFRQYTKEEFIEKIKTNDEFAKRWGELGPIYGHQWRKWGKRNHDSIQNQYFEGVDQIQNLINDLKNNPDSRRLMVTAWNPGEIDEMVLPPCHYGFQCYTRELTFDERFDYIMKKGISNGVIPNYGSNEMDSWNSWFKKENVPERAISLMWNQRSVDTFLGLPFNIASYGLLLLMIADELNMIPDELIGSLGDTHLYLNHLEQAKEQISREPYELPKVVVQDGIYCSSTSDVFLEGYESHPKIDAELSN